MSTGPVISLINLGCPKNTVDSEHILGGLVSRGFLVASEPEDAELCLINTCGFIDAAKQESIDTILEVAELKEGSGPLRAVVAMGCMVERHRDELEESIPEVDAWIGFADYDRLPELCERLVVPGQALPSLAPTKRKDAPRRAPDGVTGKADGVHHEVTGAFLSAPRMRIGERHVAHLKISEGCDHPCTFCAIPKMRGGHQSRPMDWIVDEAKRLVELGVREIVLIAQDTTNYGRDLYGKPCLPKLLDGLMEVDGDPWFRVLYAHPAHLDTDTMDRIANEPRICSYLDMPIQHIEDEMLRRMRRGTSGAHIRGLLEKLKSRNENIALRSTLIAGYPGETDEQFQTLLDFVKEGWFAHLGCFAYSEEEGTPAALETNSIPEDVRAARRDEVLAAQQAIAFARLDALQGKTIPAIVDAPMIGLEDAGCWTGRSEWDAPQIDGLLLLDADEQEIGPGAIVDVEVTGRSEYDLEARCVNVTRAAEPVTAGIYEV